MILGPKEKELIQKWFHADLNALRLQKIDKSIDLEFIINQIKGQKKAKSKFPTWFYNEDILYPPYLSMEQSSSELTAKRKACFFQKGSVLDMTGGMGIDACFISESVDKYTLCEQQQVLAEINQHNFKLLSRNNIEIHLGDSIEYLRKTNEVFNNIYLDPARRNEAVQTKANKVFFLEDCEPNVIEHWELLKEKSNQIIIKLSPMLDITHAINKLDSTSKVIIIAVKNEVKELLLIYNKDSVVKEHISINLLNDESEMYYSSTDHQKVENHYESIRQYLYEPNKAILKANLQDQYNRELGLKKLHPNTQFYTSNTQIPDYQGKSFEVVHVLPSSPKAIKKLIPSKNLNVISRNHPLKAPAIEKKYQLKSGNDGYLIAFTDIESKKIVFAKLLE